MTPPDGIQRISQLWLVTYINEAGQEIVAQAKLGTGEYAPLIAADVARLESMMPAWSGESQQPENAPYQIHQSLRHRGHRAMSILASRNAMFSSSAISRAGGGAR